VVVFGRGGSGKSTLCRRLGDMTGLPVIELDTIYWNNNLDVLSSDEWTRRQMNIVDADKWILDGDLGPNDVLEPRLARADTVVIVDTPLLVCIWRAFRRGNRRIDFWMWVLMWRRKYGPMIMRDVQKFAPLARCITLTNKQDIQSWLANETSS